MPNTRLDAVGPNGQAVPNTLTTGETPSRHLAVCLPGFGYRATMPVLYYPMRHLAGLGADLLTVDYAYDLDPSFKDLSAAAVHARIQGDVGAVLDAALALRDYAEITLIGKSLGALALSLLLTRDRRLANARALWLTPMLGDGGCVERMLRCPQRGLVAIGTADPHYDAAKLARLRDGGFMVVELAGADHSIEIKGDVAASLRAIATAMQAVIAFLGPR
jgi:hypothetical protein